ncbi:relaxase domain-containing protein [Anatilimnocola sp. NA78]|uniref:relaxase domain-containing protein n=1 Tax=Anatilimnocola sp. NA78 TaxID=3415683 RepID=UPI003CE460E5
MFTDPGFRPRRPGGLCENRDPRSGSQLTKITRADRRVGWDFTFSVPKSVSLAYELTGADRIRSAFEQSIDETMQEAEGEPVPQVDVSEAAKVGGKRLRKGPSTPPRFFLDGLLLAKAMHDAATGDIHRTV